MLLQDLSYALRQLRKNPGFTALAVGTLALGIAANGTIFSWINSTLLTPIPGVASTGNMVTIQRGDRSEHPTPPFSYGDYVDLRDNVHGFSGLLGYHDDYISITGSGKPERIYGALTSSNYFEVLGVRPILGRTLLPTAANERAGAPEAVLGYDLWQNRFASDPEIVGKKIELNMHAYTIVGVAPPGFIGCKTGLRTEIWLPLGMDHQIWGSDRIQYRDVSWLNVLGVLRPGVDRHKIENELNLQMQRIVDRYPAAHQGANRLSTDPLWRSPFGANVYLSGTLPILLSLAAVLLLLACANVANLLLVRSVARRREYAIRLSMGASRWRLVRQMMIENLLIALAGGAAALVCTLWTAKTLAAFLPPTTLPLAINGHVDRTVLLATMLVSILTAVISGAVPALRASSLSPVTVLKDEALNTSGGLHKSRLSGSLVVAQVALSLLLLACAGLFVRSLEKAQEADPGFDPNNVFLASFDLDPMGYTRRHGNRVPKAVAGADPDAAWCAVRDAGGFFATQLHHSLRRRGTRWLCAAPPRIHGSGPRKGGTELSSNAAHAADRRTRFHGSGYGCVAACGHRQPGAGEPLLAGSECDREADSGSRALVHGGGRGGQRKVSAADLRPRAAGLDASHAAL